MFKPSIKLSVVFLIILFFLVLVPVNPTWAGNHQQTIPTMPPDTETPTVGPSPTKTAPPTLTNIIPPTNTLRPGENTPVPPSSTPIPSAATPAATDPGGASTPTPINSSTNAITFTPFITTDPLSTAGNPVRTATIIGLSANTIEPSIPSGEGPTPTPTPTMTPEGQASSPAGGVDWKWAILFLIALVLFFLWSRFRPKVKK